MLLHIGGYQNLYPKILQKNKPVRTDSSNPQEAFAKALVQGSLSYVFVFDTLVDTLDSLMASNPFILGNKKSARRDSNPLPDSRFPFIYRHLLNSSLIPFDTMGIKFSNIA